MSYQEFQGTPSGSDVLLKTLFPLLPWLWGSVTAVILCSELQNSAPSPSPAHHPCTTTWVLGAQKIFLHALPRSAKYLHLFPCFYEYPNVPQTAFQLFIFLILLEGWIPQRRTEFLGSTFPFVRARELVRLQSSCNYSQVLCYSNPLLWEFGRWI